MKRKRTDHSCKPYARRERSRRAYDCGFIVTPHGIVGFHHFPDDGSGSAHYLSLVTYRMEYMRVVEPALSDRGLLTEAKRFAAEYA